MMHLHAEPSSHTSATAGSIVDRAVDTLDPSALAELRAAGGGPDFVTLLIDQFMDEADALVAALRAAIEHREVQQAAAAAHRLKDCAQSIGVKRLAALCAQVETTVRGFEDDPERLVAGILMPIESELRRARHALTAARAQLTGRAHVRGDASPQGTRR